MHFSHTSESDTKGTFIFLPIMLGEFCMNLPWWQLHRSDLAILKILIFCHFMAEKRPKIQYGRHFWQFSSHKMAKIQNFQNRQIRFVELHIRKVLSKFQVASMYAAQMNVPFILYKLSRFKVFARSVITCKSRFSKNYNSS